MPSGMWVATAQADYVLYEEQTSPMHQRHIILHEIGHMVCGHPSAAGIALRMRYSDRQEQEAELMASLIMETAARSSPPSSGGGPPSGLQAAMGLRGTHQAGAAPCGLG
ncbi:hypothetical protein ABT373_30670 [Streptomyces sp. NPDC000070]|uniref:ImmA/IrrE family metallo-endopeptidase n=1 Tax=Streptomyces sp. NPDC000070 TaxID=3154240 RepID=UPI003316A4AE